MTIALNATQRDVIEKMRDGWVLMKRTEIGTKYKFKTVVSLERDGRKAAISTKTLNGLSNRMIVRASKFGNNFIAYELTMFGKTIIIEKP